MPIVFEMWVESDTDEQRAALTNHFDGLKTDLLTGRSVTWRVSHPYSESKGIGISSDDLTNCGVSTVEDVLETTECGIRLYSHLKSGPDFAFARVAMEAENIPAGELPDYVELLLDRPYLTLECALHKTLFEKLGSPAGFRPFRENYFWNPYRGETYRPLWSKDQRQLAQLFRAMFPD